MTPSIRGVSLAGGLVAIVTALALATPGQAHVETDGPTLDEVRPVPTLTLERRGIDLDTLTTLEGVFTEAQAQAGRQVYDVECSLCHGPREFAGRIFQLTWTGQPLSSLYRHISLSMPLDNPGGLDTEQYVAVLAYILELNGYPAGEMSLPASTEALGGIRMVRLPETDGGARPE